MKLRTIYDIRHHFSSVIMILALLWLTVSLPFVNDARNADVTSTCTELPGDEQSYPCEENTPPGSAEEKNAGSSTASEEYLHSHHLPINLHNTELSHKHGIHKEMLVTFHGELLTPPPEHTLS